MAGQAVSGLGERGWPWVLGGGLLLIAAGVLAMAAPGLTTVAVSIFLGWLLLLVGIAGIIMGVRARKRHRRWTDILYGALSLAVALLVLFDPLAGAISVTFAFGLWLALRGAIEIGGAVRSQGGVRGALLLTGLVDIGLAVLLLLNFPYPAVFALGLFVGLSFLLGGIMSVVVAVQLRRLETVPSTAAA